jgi:predicted RND superfamily exporter protein
VIKLEAQLKKLPAVSSVDSMTLFMNGDQSRKLEMVTQIKKDLCDLHFEEADTRPVVLTNLSATLFSTGGYLGLAGEATKTNEPALSQQLLAMKKEVNALRKDMLAGDPAQKDTNAVKLGEFQAALFDDVHDTFQALQTQDTSGPMRIEDLPQALRDRFVGITGKYLLMVFPKKDVWNRENQKEFIDQVQTVDPNVTGTPVQLYHYTELLKTSYEQAAKYSLMAIAILVLIHFRSGLCLALSLVPVGIGVVWLGGLMGYFNVPLNPANIMTLPLVIGIGVTNGIHILNRFAEEQTANILARSTGKAVLVSGLTAIAGFGSLILAKHRGIQSLGYVMSTGLATCMIAGLTCLPAILSLLTRGSLETKQPSADNARSTLGREEPR